MKENETKIGIRYTKLIKKIRQLNKYFTDSVAGAASVLTVALQLPNYWKVNICILISKRTQAHNVKTISFHNNIISSTIIIKIFFTVAILNYFISAHLPQLSGGNSCIF